MNILEIKLVTSNEFKLKEFRRFGLDLRIEKGLDLKEVDGTSEEVVIYKALEAGEGKLVEDTILMIDGKEVVDIRNKIDEMAEFEESDAQWIVSLALLQDGKVHIASASVKGVIRASLINPVDSFGFDAYFQPNDSKDNLSLYQLELAGEKDSYSARKKAIESFINQSDSFKTIDKNDVPLWTGAYQKIDH